MKLIFGQKSVERLPKDLPSYGLIDYADSNFARDSEDRKSVRGYCLFMNGAVVSWSSKKQKTVSTSTNEAGYIAFGYVAREAIWMKKFINKMGLEVIADLTLHEDNEMSIVLTKNTESQHQTKHIDVQYYDIR